MIIKVVLVDSVLKSFAVAKKPV